ncbi:MAG: 1-acyl-sn-glycerol-3-phosphate acyltransferase [Gloeomargaritaceae cyanobacterium C42_A2020_066]|nr:1-acyl-sn-glycerol-3-phosphate acyltransferase [Gloeomargaritaceae cyanobacterium C42_A2020_066]
MTPGRPQSGLPDINRPLLASCCTLARAVLPLYFQSITVVGREHIPATGPLLITPTHRSRWDGILVNYLLGWPAGPRLLRFMVLENQFVGIQGWLIPRMGGFPVNRDRPSRATLKLTLDILGQGESLVVFPEGHIHRDHDLLPVKPGILRLALQAHQARPDLQILPVSLLYSPPTIPWWSRVQVHIAPPIDLTPFQTQSSKMASQALADRLTAALATLTDTQRKPYNGDVTFS